MFPPAPEVAPARVALSLIVPPTTTPVWLAAVGDRRVVLELGVRERTGDVLVRLEVDGRPCPVAMLTELVVVPADGRSDSQPVVAASVTV